MLADDIGLHEWDTFQLIVADGIDERMLGQVEESFVHELDLVLEVGQCMNIVGCMADGLVGQQL